MERTATEDAVPAPRPHSPHEEQGTPLPPLSEQNETPLPEPRLPKESSQQDLSTGSTKSRPVSGVVPPYWQRHERGSSRASQTSLARSTLITLEDHTADPDCETSRGLWARSVSIDDHVVVQGKTGVGAYVVWNCNIQTLDVSREPLKEIFNLTISREVRWSFA